MVLSLWENIGNFFTNMGEAIKNFFLTYGSNPFLWVGIIVVGLVIFELTYQALKTKGE